MCAISTTVPLVYILIVFIALFCHGTSLKEIIFSKMFHDKMTL